MTLRLNACEEHEQWQVMEHNWCFSNVFVQKQALFLPLLFNPGPTRLWMWLGWHCSGKVEYLIKNGKTIIKIDYCRALFSWGKRSCGVSSVTVCWTRPIPSTVDGSPWETFLFEVLVFLPCQAYQHLWGRTSRYCQALMIRLPPHHPR